VIIILGLIILAAAVVAGVAGVLGNGGSGHAVTHFAVFGYHVTGSTGTLFLYGIVLGAVGLFGLGVLLAAVGRTSRRGSAARRGLKQSRRETAAASQERDDLIDQRETARAATASGRRDPSPGGHRQLSPDDGRWSGLHNLFGRRSAPRPAGATEPESPPGLPANDVPVASQAPADDALQVSQP
jgi:hypothetical protein